MTHYCDCQMDRHCDFLSSWRSQNISLSEIRMFYRGQVPVLSLRDIVTSEEDHAESHRGEKPEEGGVTDDGLEAGHDGGGEDKLQLVKGEGKTAPYTPGLRRGEKMSPFR